MTGKRGMNMSSRKTGLMICIMVAVVFCAAFAAADTVTIPEGVTMIEEEAFYGDTSLDEVVIPEGVECIGAGAFAESSVKSITLPASLTAIGEGAFANTQIQTVNAPAGSFAEQWAAEKKIIPPNDPSDFTYTIENGECTITKYTGSRINVIVPDFIENTPVTRIGSQCFYNNDKITSVVLPDSVTYLDYYAFSGCEGLRAINLPQNLKTIATHAFFGCRGLGTITIPASITIETIGSHAFSCCYSLKTITIPSVKKIDPSAFEYCRQLESITFSESLTELRECAFVECNSLTEVSLPDSLLKIGYSAFRGCTSLPSIQLPGQLTTIGEKAFENCESLTSVTLPGSITQMENAFEECSGLVSIDISALTVEWNYAFRNCSNLKEVKLPEEVKRICYGAFEGCSSLTSFTIPASVIEIGFNAFKNTGLTSIELPESVKIGNRAFADCKYLESITIPDGVADIGGGVFYNCTGLSSVSLPDSLKTIGNSAFSNCRSLKTLTIPESVSKVEDDAFNGCTNLTFSYDPDSSFATWIQGKWTVENPIYLGYGQKVKPHVVYLSGGWVEDYTLKSSYPDKVAVEDDQIRLLQEEIVGWDPKITITAGGQSKTVTAKAGMRMNVGGGKNLYYTKKEDGYLLKMGINDKARLYPVISVPFDAYPVYTVKDRTIVECDEEGHLTPKRVGKTRISVTVPTRTSVMYVNCDVEVTKETTAEIEISARTYNLGVGEKIDITAKFTSEEEGKVHFRISDGKIMGLTMLGTRTAQLYAKEPGKVAITAYTDDGRQTEQEFIIHGDGFKSSDPQTAFSSARNKIQPHLTKVVDAIQAASKDKEETIKKKVTDYIGIDTMVLIGLGFNADDVEYIKKNLEEYFTKAINKLGNEATSYKDCNTDNAMVKKIIGNILDSSGKDAIEFNIGRTKYTCTYEATGFGKTVMAFGTIKDSNGHSAPWGHKKGKEADIRKEMDFLREYAELKIDDVKKAIVSDIKAIMKVDDVQAGLVSIKKSAILSEIEEVSSGVKKRVEEMTDCYKKLKDLAKDYKDIMDNYTPQSLTNSEDIIKKISDYHKKIEAIIAAIDALVY